MIGVHVPLLCARLVFNVIRLGVDLQDEVLVDTHREVDAVIFLLRLKHRRHVALQEREVHLIIGHAFSLAAHDEGGDVIAVAVMCGHGVEVEGALVVSEDLDSCIAFVGVLD